MFSSVKERWSHSGAKQKRSFSPRLERRGRPAPEGRVHSRNTSANTESTLKSAAISSITTLRPSPPISPSIGSSPLNSSHFAALPTSVGRRKSMILPSKTFNEDNIFVTPRRLKSALDLKANTSPFSYTATPSPVPHYVPPSYSQPVPELLPRPRNAVPRSNRLVTPQERDFARQALQGESDPIDLCIADNIEYDLNHGLLTAPKLPPSPFQLVYYVKTNTFRRERRDQLLKKGEEGEVLLLEESNPPLLVDGRKIILEVPRWNRGMEIWWRIIDVNGVIRKKNARIVFPLGVWLERNFGAAREKGMELFIEK